MSKLSLHCHTEFRKRESVVRKLSRKFDKPFQPEKTTNRLLNFRAELCVVARAKNAASS